MLSIIVPVYNVENRLRKCLDSIIGQKNVEFEIVLVDDGSTDSSSQICDEYLEKYPNIINLVHQNNKGLSAARNTGIALAKGDLLGFVDSDDYIEPNMYCRLYNAIQEYDADIVIEYFNVVKSDGNYYPKMDNGIQIFDESNHNDVFLNYYNERRGITTVVWNKLYRRALFESCRFTVNAKYEDKLLMHHLLGQAKKIVYLNSWGYNYWLNDSGITLRRNADTAWWDYYATQDRFKYLSALGNERIILEASKDLANQAISFWKESSRVCQFEQRKIVKKDYKAVYKYLARKKLGLKEKMKYFVYFLRICLISY